MAKKKEFHEYLVESKYTHILHEDYIISPASAFLRYSTDAKDSIQRCISSFSRKSDGSYTKDSHGSMEHLVSAMLPALMGHFETFQRYLFAGIFEYSIYLNGFDTKSFFDKINKDSLFSIDPVRLAAYRGYQAPVGIVLADTMPGWHDPVKVNKYFQLFKFKTSFFSNDDCDRLKVLWQLRHSIVHTGGTLTIPDAQKVKPLSEWGGYPVTFEDRFIFEVSRKLHPLVKNSVGRLESCFREKLADDIDQDIKKGIDSLFRVKSNCSAWLQD